MTYKNIREITKKEKYKGLTKTSWNLAVFGSISFFPYINFGSFILFIFLLTIFYIAEYFDDDFIEIIAIKIQIKVKNEYFA
jgi:hypothetical protein